MSGLLHGLLYGLPIITVVLTVTALGLWFERKFAARIQSRKGPTMVGPAGILQPLADVVKMLQKEQLTPAAADRVLFELAPILCCAFAVATAANSEMPSSSSLTQCACQTSSPSQPSSCAYCAGVRLNLSRL